MNKNLISATGCSFFLDGAAISLICKKENNSTRFYVYRNGVLIFDNSLQAHKPIVLSKIVAYIKERGLISFKKEFSTGNIV